MKLYNWPSSTGSEFLKPKEFIEYYSNAYYISRNGKVYKQIKNAKQSSEFIENDIDRILQNGIREKTEVFHILAWKMGGIDHKASQLESKKSGTVKYEYNSPDKNGNQWTESVDCFTALHRGNVIPNVEKLIDYIIRKTDDWNSLSFNRFEDAEQFLWDVKYFLLRNQIKYIGPVYLITLLYFVSKGKYPIYDQQAAKALKAINNVSIKPNDKVEILELPSVESPKFMDTYKKYIESLESLCKDIYGEDEKKRYQNDRDIDRALWVYGHLFK